jgi:hypothetical protein
MPYLLALALVAATLFTPFAIPASAVTIDWVDWTTATVGTTTGTAQGTAPSNGVTVSYTGQVFSTTTTNGSFPSYGPAGTFSGGTVSNAPSPHDIIGLTGGTSTGTNTITFSTAVVNPVMAIWSLGQGGVPATFVFSASEPFSIQSGGPSAEFGGSTITQAANVVSGVEGNGTIQFAGTFTSLTWTNPVFENWYGFTLGIAGTGGGTPSVPEPSSWLLLGLALTGVAWWRWKHAAV